MTDQEINEAVARKLGWKPNVELAGFPSPNNAKWYRDGIISSCDVPADYCHSIEAAWEIVEKRPYMKLVKAANCFRCEFVGEDGVEVKEGNVSAPMAICLAFLKLEDR